MIATAIGRATTAARSRRSVAQDACDAIIAIFVPPLVTDAARRRGARSDGAARSAPRRDARRRSFMAPPTRRQPSGRDAARPALRVPRGRGARARRTPRATVAGVPARPASFRSLADCRPDEAAAIIAGALGGRRRLARPGGGRIAARLLRAAAAAARESSARQPLRRSPRGELGGPVALKAIAPRPDAQERRRRRPARAPHRGRRFAARHARSRRGHRRGSPPRGLRGAADGRAGRRAARRRRAATPSFGPVIACGAGGTTAGADRRRGACGSRR